MDLIASWCTFTLKITTLDKLPGTAERDGRRKERRESGEEVQVRKKKRKEKIPPVSSLFRVDSMAVG